MSSTSILERAVASLATARDEHDAKNIVGDIVRAITKLGRDIDDLEDRLVKAERKIATLERDRR